MQSPISRLVLRSLSPEEASLIYTEQMIHDFPPRERIPLKPFIRNIRRQVGFGFGFYENNQLRCYAFFMQDTPTGGVLLDYFAVLRPFRGQGYGSEALKVLQNLSDRFSWIMLEVEDPDATSSPEEKELRQRRIAFYLRAGILPRNLKYHTFGVTYRILQFPVASAPADPELDLAYNRIYTIKVGPVLRRLQVRKKKT